MALQSPLFKRFQADPVACPLPDFSYAGYGYGHQPIPYDPITVDVTEHGIKPNTQEDLTDRVQILLDEVGAAGGGVVFFPAGEYCFNKHGAARHLQINHSHVVLRGAGSDETGTVFRLCRPLTQTDRAPWLSPALIRTADHLQGTQRFWGVRPWHNQAPEKEGSPAFPRQDGQIDAAPHLTNITVNADKGQRVLSVADATGIEPGDVVLLALRNSDASGDLIHALLSPMDAFHPDQVSPRLAGPLGAASYQWLVEVAQVPDANTVVLAQPLRREAMTCQHPALHAAPMLQQVGIEQMRFVADWEGPYQHHGLPESTQAQADEMNYGWNAICLARVAHGWVRGVTVEHYTVPIQLLDSRNITVGDVQITDPKQIGGHYSVKCYSHACDNLIEDVRVMSYRTHGTGVEGNAYGNVFRNIVFDHPGQRRADMDSHGFAEMPFSPPGCNLFENIQGQGRISGGGALTNLPHTAAHNTFWNYTCAQLHGEDELFWSHAAQRWGLQDHQLFPQSILIGVNHPTKQALIAGSGQDRDDDWLYTEALNQGPVEPRSLYEAQMKLRRQRQHRSVPELTRRV